jgi:hypothetical protein
MSLFGCPQRLLCLANRVLAAGGVGLLVGLLGAYGLEQHLGVPALVGAHSLTVLGPALLKLGYVLRLNAQHRLRRPDSAGCCPQA